MRVLIVDDNKSNRLTLELLLEDFDFEIDEAVDGYEAIEKASLEEYDIIFMDIMMPRLDGISAVKELRKLGNSSMVIAVSALGDSDSIERMMQAGANDYVVKPIVDELIQKRVESYISLLSVDKKVIVSSGFRNLFNDAVSPFSQQFIINEMEALNLFMGYLLDGSSSHYGLKTARSVIFSDVVRLIYSIGKFTLKKGENFKCVLEENEYASYFNLCGITQVKENTLRNLFQNHFPGAKLIIKEDAVCIKVTKQEQVSEKSIDESVSEIQSQESEKESEEESEEESLTTAILRKTHFDKISAIEYVNNTPIELMDKLDKLDDLEDTLDQIVFHIEGHPEEAYASITPFVENFSDYIVVITELNEFEHLAFALDSLRDFIAKLKETQLDETHLKLFTMMLTNTLSDLKSWRESLFVKQEAIDIHYLDSSLLSSCLQIEEIFKETDDTEDEDDFGLELF
jgi:CheY-like chemotaxis protein